MGSGRVVVVSPASLMPKVREVIARQARADWEQQQQVVIVPIPDGSDNSISSKVKSAQWIADAVNRIARKYSVDTLLLIAVGGVTIATDCFRENVHTTPKGTPVSLRNFERRKLPKALSAFGLDWLAQTERQLANAWFGGLMHDSEREAISAWLLQFERLEQHRWVGESLLRLLDIWNEDRVARALGSDALCAMAASGVHICVNQRVPGKSADVLATLINKRIKPSKIRDLHASLDDEPEIQVIACEDCLLTGTEASRVFRELMGDPPLREAKASSLSRPELLRNRSVELRYAVVTNWGVAELERVFAEKGLLNIRIRTDNCLYLKTLTEHGVAATRAGGLLDENKCVRNPEWIRPAIFLDAQPWGGTERMDRARRFLRLVGEQLIRAYLKQNDWTWHDLRIQEASLGVRSNALAIVFSHSIPKETLPVFWMGGDVHVNGRSQQWRPLFANAI